MCVWCVCGERECMCECVCGEREFMCVCGVCGERECMCECMCVCVCVPHILSLSDEQGISPTTLVIW